jgi:hypothetical protein
MHSAFHRSLAGSFGCSQAWRVSVPVLRSQRTPTRTPTHAHKPSGDQAAKHGGERDEKRLGRSFVVRRRRGQLALVVCLRSLAFRLSLVLSLSLSLSLSPQGHHTAFASSASATSKQETSSVGEDRVAVVVGSVEGGGGDWTSLASQDRTLQARRLGDSHGRSVSVGGRGWWQPGARSQEPGASVGCVGA